LLFEQQKYTKRMKEYSLSPIAWIDTPFNEKFGIPRQSVGLSLARGRIKFREDINVANACRGLDEFSHLWLSFVFHQHSDKKWSDTVRPPRLGGNERVGVFASRATHRPNPIGLSLVKNEGINANGELVVSGVDLLNDTPILDIKPYLDYADCVNEARCGYAPSKPKALKHVSFSKHAEDKLNKINKIQHDFRELLVSILEQDPRPAYKQRLATDPKQYHISLYHWNITWSVTKSGIDVTKIET
jgi:tRNA-Thr(GGU) m(6)t(6)A37 methyltransferase TsaA